MPLAHALIYIRNKRLSGVLELRASRDRHAWLVFWRGLVVSSMTTPTIARFGTVVYELGYIDGDTLDATAMESATVKRTQMDLLLERGAITYEQRDRILAEQVRRRVHHLFTFPPEATFMFREGDPSSNEPLVAVDVLAPVWRGLRDFPPDERAGEVLSRIGEHTLRLVSEVAIERAELATDEVALCQLLTEPMTLKQLRAASTLPAARVDLLAYLLVITRCVEVEGLASPALPSAAMWTAVRIPVSSSASPMSPMPTSSSSSMNAVIPHNSTDRLTAAARGAATAPAPPLRGPRDLGVAEIRRRAAALRNETPFATLGLPEGASAEAARAAYFRLGRLWQPERLAPDLEEVRAEVERIWAYMTQAHRLLTDPAARPAVVSRNGR